MATTYIDPDLIAGPTFSGAYGFIGGYGTRAWIGQTSGLNGQVTFASSAVNENLITAISGGNLCTAFDVTVGAISTEQTMINSSGSPVYNQKVPIRFKSKTPAVAKRIEELMQSSGVFIILERFAPEQEKSTASATAYFEIYGVDNNGLNCREQQGGAATHTVGANQADPAETMLTFSGHCKMPKYFIKDGASSTYVEDLAIVTAIEYTAP